MTEEQKKKAYEKAILILQALYANLPPRGAEGCMDCPACKGEQTLWYSRCTYSGHLSAYCSSCGIRMKE